MKKGFIITGIIYSMFLLFVVVLFGNLSAQVMVGKLAVNLIYNRPFSHLILDDTVGGYVVSGGTETFNGAYTVRTF